MITKQQCRSNSERERVAKSMDWVKRMSAGEYIKCPLNASLLEANRTTCVQIIQREKERKTNCLYVCIVPWRAPPFEMNEWCRYREGTQQVEQRWQNSNGGGGIDMEEKQWQMLYACTKCIFMGWNIREAAAIASIEQQTTTAAAIATVINCITLNIASHYHSPVQAVWLTFGSRSLPLSVFFPVFNLMNYARRSHDMSISYRCRN